jgi:hypothetical protein
MILEEVMVMPIDFDTDSLNIIGAQITTIGDLIGAQAAQKEASEEENEKKEAEDMAVLSALLVLIGDGISFIAAIIEFQESMKDDSKEMDPHEEESLKLSLIGAFLNVAGDIYELKASL